MRIYNFNAGPSMLPEQVLMQAQTELLDWHGTGMSIMEMGHRGPEFKEVADQADSDLRELMGIPKNYKIFFLAGGATAQFAMIPLNLFGKSMVADYVDTGIWSRKAIAEAKRYGTAHVIATTEKRDNLISIPHQQQWQLHDEAAYVHYTPNETIDGVEFNWVPETGEVPLIADMSSMILSRPINVSQYGLIYAGAQKNMGQAGIAVVIIREDLIHEALPHTPTLYTYQIHAENHSFYNTPPTFSWYLSGLVLKWMKSQGGVNVFYELNKQKASKLYHCIDTHAEFYRSAIHPDSRSMMNVVFTIQDETLIPRFLEEAKKAALANLRGHRIAGGLRASIYNAMPLEGVLALVSFMEDFAKRNG